MWIILKNRELLHWKHKILSNTIHTKFFFLYQRIILPIKQKTNLFQLNTNHKNKPKYFVFIVREEVWTRNQEYTYSTLSICFPFLVFAWIFHAGNPFSKFQVKSVNAFHFWYAFIRNESEWIRAKVRLFY